jgi:hypothetical protein
LAAARILTILLATTSAAALLDFTAHALALVCADAGIVITDETTNLSRSFIELNLCPSARFGEAAIIGFSLETANDEG